MANQFLDFEKEKVQSITLDQLELTHKENNVYGEPLRGIYHYKLVEDVLAMCREFGYQTEVYDMFAAQNRDRTAPGVVLLPQVEAQFGEKAVEAHILRRVYTNVRLTDFDDEERTTNIAIAFHQRGIQVGFGNMVKICHNQCMLGAEQYAATYSDKGEGKGSGKTIAELLDAVRSWLVDARQIVITEREKIDRMKQITVLPEQAYTMIGMLTALRVKCDTSNKDLRENRVYPLNQAQISQFTENLLVRYAKCLRVSLWDVYNAATDLYKARTMDIPQLLPQNRAFVQFIEQTYAI